MIAAGWNLSSGKERRRPCIQHFGHGNIDRGEIEDEGASTSNAGTHYRTG